MHNRIISVLSSVVISLLLVSCSSDPFASAKGSLGNVSWDISNAEEITDKVALYSLGNNAMETMLNSKKLVVTSDKLDLKPVAMIPIETRFEEYLKNIHDLGIEEISTVKTEDYIDNTNRFYKTAHLYEIKDASSQYCSPRFLVLDQAFNGRPIYRLPYNNSAELISWDDHTYWRYFGCEQSFRADDLMIMYDDGSYPWQNAEPVSNEFVPINPVQGIKTVVDTVISRHGKDDPIHIYSAELYYVQGAEWIGHSGSEGSLGDELFLIPVWKYDYSLSDKDGNVADMGSVFIRPDNGQIAESNDQNIVNAIHAPG